MGKQGKARTPTPHLVDAELDVAIVMFEHHRTRELTLHKLRHSHHLAAAKKRQKHDERDGIRTAGSMRCKLVRTFSVGALRSSW
jgi:hypothetical protein